MIPFLPIFSLLLLCVVNPANSNSYYDKVLAHSRIRGRDQGPNVCALQQILGTKKKYFSSCKNWYQGAICGKKTTVLYECCPGYMRMEGMKGCPAVMPIDHVYGTLGIVGATTTQHYSDVSKLRAEIEGKGSYTYFAPSNEAWENLDSDIRKGLESNVNVELLNALHSHMVDKRMLTKDLKNGMVIPSMYNNLGLFINHYPNGVVTVNCARIIHGNQVATNGVVHVIDRVLTQIGTSIQDFIEGEDELSSFRVISMFQNEASFSLLKYHILNTLQCSEAIMGGAVFETMEGNTIEIGCEGDSITINGVKMVNKKDIVTNNGVIHLIDEVLIPDSAKQVTELGGKQQTTFTDLVAQLGLASSLKPDGEYTLLAPVNNAFSDDTLIMLQNHIMNIKVALNELYNGQILEPIGGPKTQSLRDITYLSLLRSKQGRNGAIHAFRDIITPADKSFHEKLKQDKRFSIFLSLLEAADLKDLLSQPGEWTLFAPTNDAFKGMTKEEMSILIGDKNALQNIVLYHLTPGVFIGKGFEPGVTNILKTSQGSKIYVKGVNDTLLVTMSHVMSLNTVIYFQFVRGSTFKEIPMTVYRPTLTKLQIEGEPEFKLIKEGEPRTEIIHGEPIIKTYTKIIDGVPVEITEKQTREERIITGPEIKYTRVSAGGGETEETLKKLLQKEVSKVTKFIEGGDDHLFEDEDIKRLLQGDTPVKKIQAKKRVQGKCFDSSNVSVQIFFNIVRS
uniref:Periostin n=1 Tax=Cavia porcellus TaxID=10141 RepID=A0A286XP24_CAVPO